MQQLEKLIRKRKEYPLAALKRRSHNRIEVETRGEIFKCSQVAVLNYDATLCEGVS